MILERLLKRVKSHEGTKLKPYLDTKGKLTIGTGRNLDDVGITEQEADILLRNDIATASRELVRAFPWVNNLDDIREEILIEMCFNLGITRFKTFKKMISFCKAGDYQKAADEMIDSKWARDVGDRAKALANLMRKGE